MNRRAGAARPRSSITVLRRRAFGLAAAFAALLIAASAWPSAVRATIAQALSMNELVQQADLIVLATATDQQARRDRLQRIVTDFTLRIDEVTKGDRAAGDSVVMTRLGGAIGDLGMRVEGEPQLVIGERYLFFLYVASDGRTLRPVGMSQGVMPVEDHAGVLRVLPGGSGMALVERVRGGQLVQSAPALLHPEAYDSVRDRLTEMVERDRDREGGAVRP